MSLISKQFQRYVDEMEQTALGKLLGLHQYRVKRLNKFSVTEPIPFKLDSLEPLKEILSKYSQGKVVITNNHYPYLHLASTDENSVTSLSLKSELNIWPNEKRLFTALVIQKFNLDQWERGDTVLKWLRYNGGNLGFERLVYQSLYSDQEINLARSNGFIKIPVSEADPSLGLENRRTGSYYCPLEKRVH